ncbi:hypothetical protein Hanom_Chr03g00267221 [Helianthus anomalus]
MNRYIGPALENATNQVYLVTHIHIFTVSSLTSSLCVDTYYVDTTWFGSTRFGSTRLGSAQARHHDILPSCVPEFDTRSTKRREPVPAATSS